MRFLLVCVLVLVAPASAWGQTTKVVELTGATRIEARAVNDDGQVTGIAEFTPSAPQAFRSTPAGGLEALAGNGAGGNDINNAGVVVGTAAFTPSGGCPREILGAVWRANAIEPLGGVPVYGGNVACQGSRQSYAEGINDDGKIVGAVFTNCPGGEALAIQGAVLAPGFQVSPGACPGTNQTEWAYDVNVFGSVLVDRQGAQAWLVRGGSPTAVGLDPGRHGLNDSHIVVGQRAEAPKLAARWVEGSFQPLAPLPGYDESYANAISNSGLVVGYSQRGQERVATMWRLDNSPADLNALRAPDVPFSLASAADISDDGNHVTGQIAVASGSPARSFSMKLAVEPELGVKLEGLLPDGSPADGRLVASQDLLAKVTLTNEGDVPLRSFTFAGGTPLVIDGRGTGGLGATGAIGFPADMTLAPDESQSAYLALTTTREGVAAVHTKAAALTEAGVPAEGSGSLLFRIANRQKLTQAIAEYVLMRAVDQYVFENLRTLHRSLSDHGQELRKGLVKTLDGKERRRWFGSEAGKLDISLRDRAMGFLRGASPELVAAETPKDPARNLTVEQLNREYDEAFKDEVGEGVKKWVKGYTDLAGDVKKGLSDTWAEAVLGVHYVTNTATREERLQAEVFMTTYSDGVAADSESVVNTLKAEIPRWQENGLYAMQALQEAERNGGVRGFKRSVDKLIGAYDKATTIPKDMLELAESDPLRFQREAAKRDAGFVNVGVPAIFDTLLGAAPARILAAGKRVKIAGGGASIIEAAEAAGFLDDSGRIVKSPKAILPSVNDVASGMSTQAAIELDAAGGLLANTKGATLVQASDLGNVYELPNLGGVPEVTLEAKAGILGSIEKEYAAAFGKPPPKLVEVLKPSSALRKPGGVAKVELTAGKTGKPAMIDAGMPPDALAEANYWTGPNPKQLPGFRKLPKARQQAALDEWAAADKRYKAFLDPAPGSKEAKLKSLIGDRGRVPLDDAPNKAGLQRFVTAQFEEVTVREGKAVAKLIRVKHYEIEVVDTTRNGLVVNRKTVVDNLSKAAAQTADADAVAVGKVVGKDAKGNPIIAPLDRAEREFVMGRYVDRNVKARRSGAIPDLAEHGVTLVMEDASAKAAGYLLPHFGAPFLPEAVGRGYLGRIAPFVKHPGLTDEQMVAQMLEAVQAEGGFGQHAVVVTSDSRYLGEVLFERW